MTSDATSLIFVGGTGRSGTTIMGRMLNRHRKIRASKPIEIKFLAGNAGLLDLLYGRRPEARERRNRSLHKRILTASDFVDNILLWRKFERRLRGSWWAPETGSGKSPGLSSGVSEEIREEALSALKSSKRDQLESGARRFFWTMIDSQVNNFGEPIWVDTSPPNIFQAARIYKFLPQAKFIHMKRDGRDTIASVLKEPWGPKDPMKAIFWWRNRVRESHQALLSIPPESYIEIYLEEFAALDRNTQYARVLSFLDIEDDLNMREFFESEVKAERILNRNWREAFAHQAVMSKFMKIHGQLESEGIPTRLFD
jgi:hypothetical protein